MASPSTRPQTLDGQVAVVTGGTRGIGWACARAIAEHGGAVVLLGKEDLNAAEGRAAQLAADFGGESLGLVADAGDSNLIHDAYKRIRREFGRVDILVNSAGVMTDGLIGMISEDQIRETLDTNVSGTIRHMQAAVRLMRREQRGSIVNISSIMGRVGNRGQVLYSASKAAVIGATLSASKELASIPIRVNAVAPGFIDTDLTRELNADVSDERIRAIGMQRIGTADEVAAVVLFLVSDASSYVTGQVLGVDGGMLI